MASRLSAVALGSGAGALLRGGGRRSAAPAVAVATAPLLARGPDTGPSRNPDIYPPGWQKPDSPVPDIYPPGDSPDMPEPPVPGKGPFMRAGYAAAAAQPIPADSPKHCSPWGAAGGSPFRARQGSCAGGGELGSGPALLLKTDGSGLEARGLHGSAAWAQERPGVPSSTGQRPGKAVGECAEENMAERGIPVEEMDKEGAGMPADSIPGYSQAAEPVSRIGKLSDDMGDVPEATQSRNIAPKVGPKASTGEPVDVPGEVPGPRFPGQATTQS
ncbi:hypothetical protein ABPG75_002129 [Micractinium tetrahymenae]